MHQLRDKKTDADSIKPVCIFCGKIAAAYEKLSQTGILYSFLFSV